MSAADERAIAEEADVVAGKVMHELSGELVAARARVVELESDRRKRTAEHCRRVNEIEAEHEAEMFQVVASRQEAWKKVDEQALEIARLKGQVEGMHAAARGGMRSIAREANRFMDSFESRLREAGILVDTRAPEPRPH